MGEPRDPLLGTVLSDRYRVLGRLGKGGFGTVYKVQHVHTGKQFAVKVLHAEFAENRRITERFWREAQTAALIDHENVVDIIDIGQTPDGLLYFSMELLRGEPLSELLQREGAVPWPRARGFAVQIARALCAAHDKGIVHRDLKPANCLRITRGDNPDFIKVLDFGVAKIIHTTDGADGAGLTSRGEVLGTPYYMAPEQAAGNVVDARADVFSFGVLLFELLTGRRPFAGNSRFEILTKMLTVPSPLVSAFAPETPPAIEALVARTLQREPEQRPASMTEVLALLQYVGEDPPGRSADEEPTRLVDRQALALAATEAVSPIAPTRALAESRSELVTTVPAVKPPTEHRPELLGTVAQGKSTARGRTLVAALAGLTIAGGGIALAVRLTDSGDVGAPSKPAPAVVEFELPAVVHLTPQPEPQIATEPQPQPPSAPIVEPPTQPPPDPEPTESVQAKNKTTTKKKAPGSPAVPPPAAAPTVTCEDALKALVQSRAAILMKSCKGGKSGITTGDRVWVRLVGNGVLRKVASSVVRSSGSSVFDDCLVAGFNRQSFPQVDGTPSCNWQFPLTVP